MKDEQIKKLFKLLDIVEKLIIRIISLIGWIKILIDILN